MTILMTPSLVLVTSKKIALLIRTVGLFWHLPSLTSLELGHGQSELHKSYQKRFVSLPYLFILLSCVLILLQVFVDPLFQNLLAHGTFFYSICPEVLIENRGILFIVLRNGSFFW